MIQATNRKQKRKIRWYSQYVGIIQIARVDWQLNCGGGYNSAALLDEELLS